MEDNQPPLLELALTGDEEGVQDPFVAPAARLMLGCNPLAAPDTTHAPMQACTLYALTDCTPPVLGQPSSATAPVLASARRRSEEVQETACLSLASSVEAPPDALPSSCFDMAVLAVEAVFGSVGEALGDTLAGSTLE